MPRSANKLMFRLKSEVQSERPWRFTDQPITTVQMPQGITWLKIKMDNGDTLLCHQSQIDCIIQTGTHEPS